MQQSGLNFPTRSDTDILIQITGWTSFGSGVALQEGVHRSRSQPLENRFAQLVLGEVMFGSDTHFGHLETTSIAIVYSSTDSKTKYNTHVIECIHGMINLKRSKEIITVFPLSLQLFIIAYMVSGSIKIVLI